MSSSRLAEAEKPSRHLLFKSRLHVWAALRFPFLLQLLPTPLAPEMCARPALPGSTGSRRRAWR